MIGWTFNYLLGAICGGSFAISWWQLRQTNHKKIKWLARISMFASTVSIIAGWFAIYFNLKSKGL